MVKRANVEAMEASHQKTEEIGGGNVAYRGLDLKGRTAVVVGGTSGIGRAIAMGLAHAGADVVATGRRLAQVNTIAAAIEAVGCRSLSLAVDVNDRTSLEDLLSTVLGTLGSVDILAISAGRIKRGPTMDSSERDWQEILGTNLMGVLRACQVSGGRCCKRIWTSHQHHVAQCIRRAA
jgi:NAD(P)-dependent dehydrogenase (short-subunit alcohol dehydrogenase family)